MLAGMLVWQKLSAPGKPSTPVSHPSPAWMGVSGRLCVTGVSQPVRSELAALPGWSVCDSDAWERRNWALVQSPLASSSRQKELPHGDLHHSPGGRKPGHSEQLKIEQNVETHHRLCGWGGLSCLAGWMG